MAVELGWYLVPPFIAGFVSAVIGGYVLYKHPKDLSSKVFFILMMGCSIWMFGEFAMQVSPTVDNALVFGKISNLGYIILPVALLNFTLVYPTIAMKPEKLKLVFSALYGPALIMIMVLLLTNRFFTVDTGERSYGPDILVDGDGTLTVGAGFADGPNGTFKLLIEHEPDYWFYYDSNGNDKFDIDENSTETLAWFNTERGSFQEIIVGWTGDNPGFRKSLDSAENSDSIWWLDTNGSSGYMVDEYDPGEDIYYDSNKHDGIQTANETTDKYIVENYQYVQGKLYVVFILFFLSIIIIAIINILNRLMRAENPKEKAQMSYLAAGLIFIILFILSYYFLGNLVSTRILDGILTISIALFFAVAVLKYNLLDIELIIKKSLFYSIVFIIIAGIFVVIGETMEALIGSVLLPGSESLIPNIISAMVVAIAFIPLTKQVKRFTDWIFPEAHRYEKEYRDRVSAYEATFEAMIGDGKITRKEKEALDILREKLVISDEEHQNIKEKLRTKFEK